MMSGLFLLLLMAPDERRLAILPTIVEGEFGRATAPEVFDAARTGAVFRAGLDLLSYNEVFVDGTRPVAGVVRGCGSDEACVGSVLRRDRIDLGLRVIVNFALEPPLWTINLFEAHGDQILAQAAGDLSDTNLAGTLANETGRLLRQAGHVRGGRLTLEIDPPDAVVKVDPKPSGRILAPGAYAITAVKEGYEPATVNVEVLAGESATARLSLSLIPEEESIWASPWLWGGVGVAVVGAAVAVLIVTNPFGGDPQTGTFCVSTASSPGC